MNTHAEYVYRFIKQYKTDHGGNSPSFREIMDGTGITSTFMIHYYMDKLISAGWVAPINGKSRSIIILENNNAP